MKRFINSIIIFCIPAFLVMMTIEICARMLPNAYKSKYEWMQNNADKVETLILGSSHTFYGIQPKYLEGNAYNLANPSQILEQDLFLLKYWSDRYIKLRRVIMPISYFTLFAKDLEPYRRKYYNIYMDCNLYPSFSFSNNFEISESKICIFKLQKLFGGINEVDWFCDEYGNEAFNSISNRDVGWSYHDAALTTFSNWDNFEHNYRIMEEIICFCKERKIQLVLITTPCWHTYYDSLEKKQLEKMNSTINELQRKYHLPYLNYLKDKRFDDKDFYDSSHLSEFGEVKFTKILNNDLKSLKR